MKWPLFFLTLSPFFAAENEVQVALRNPVYRQGILYTTQGGVIKNQEIRIQARSIQYTQRPDEHRIEAEGDLMIQYKGRVYVGSEFEYDFLAKKGTIYEGKTFSSLFYVGAEQIDLNEDGSCEMQNAFLTACENKQSSWDFHAAKVRVTNSRLFEAKNIHFRYCKIPTLWFPSFKRDFRKKDESSLKYYAAWDSGCGPKGGLRYQLYSWRDLGLYGRVEYRLGKGWGGAFETEYYPTFTDLTFVTRSYLGKDTLENAPPPAIRRYRLEGVLRHLSASRKTKTVLMWDKYSDVRMPADFHSDDFEVNTAKQTLFYTRHEQDAFIASLKVRPRFNTFESLKQDLPTLFATRLAEPLTRLGIFSAPYLKASYLNFQYSNQLVASIPDYHSGRLELSETMYRPFSFGPLTFTPSLQGLALLYTNSPSHKNQNLGLLSYGLRAHCRAFRIIHSYRHVLEPYLEYKALTRPTVSPNDHYIFSIQDGYQKIQQIELGIRNLLFSSRHQAKKPSFTASIYADAFFSDLTIPQVIPRGYLDLAWNLPSLQFTWKNCWNFRHHLPDFSNAYLKWTVNENIALTLEGRYRSRYDWRKADHTSFILDVTRSETELLLSPLSDRRITFLTRLFIRPHPLWEWQFESHHGFFRTDQNPYNELNINLARWISSAWKLGMNYSYTGTAPYHHYGISFNLRD